jgi:hypothetical protein
LQDAKPSFSYSPDESGFVKDFRWRRNDKHSYLVLSNTGKLFHGIDNAPPRHVMDAVDAVEWSSKGSYIAVAQDNSLRIFSSKFNEKRCIALSFDSWIGDSDEDCFVKGMLQVLAFFFLTSIFRFVSNFIVVVRYLRSFLMD